MTLIERIEHGDIPDILREAAKAEDLGVEEIAKGISEGTIVIPSNPRHDGCHAIGIGKGCSVKINANIGTSEDFPDQDTELEKLSVALEAGADTVMDLSTGGDINELRRLIVKNCPRPVGTVPIYQAAVRAKLNGSGIVNMSKELMFEVIEEQAQDGVDFMTIHSGVNRKAVEALVKQGRTVGVVSRGASFLIAWMLHNDEENPLYSDYDRVLEIMAKYDVTISLGDGFRPGCLADATDHAQITELLTLGELVERARAFKIQALVEGPGHMPFDQIAANVKLQKQACHGAPFYVLGPLVTDSSPGYDHITAAIGGTMAAVAGADYLCYVTPREHIGLPTVQDVHDGVVVTKIAAHAADLARENKTAWTRDLEMAKARKAFDWQRQVELALDPAKLQTSIAERHGTSDDVCSMCGDFCAMKILAEYLGDTKTLNC